MPLFSSLRWSWSEKGPDSSGALNHKGLLFTPDALQLLLICSSVPCVSSFWAVKGQPSGEPQEVRVLKAFPGLGQAPQWETQCASARQGKWRGWIKLLLGMGRAGVGKWASTPSDYVCVLSCPVRKRLELGNFACCSKRHVIIGIKAKEMQGWKNWIGADVTFHSIKCTHELQWLISW